MSKINNPLMEEFYKYESEHQLTKDEREALLKWVKNGNSVYDNPSMAYDDNGHYLDYIDVYRAEKEMIDYLRSMTSEERMNYLADLRGEDTIDNLRETINRLSFEISILEKVIAKHKLQAEVEAYRQESIECSKRTKEYITTHPIEELPFN